MSKFKHAALALAAASLMAVQAHATEVREQSPQAMPVTTFSQVDINTLFDQAGKPMQLAALSGQEMKETEGSWFWLYFLWPSNCHCNDVDGEYRLANNSRLVPQFSSALVIPDGLSIRSFGFGIA